MEIKDNSVIQNTSSAAEQEIDLVEVVQKLWRNRKFILKCAIAFGLLGILIALFSAKEYTAGCVLVPQSSQKKMGGGLSGLAAIAGINLGDMGGGEVLSPKIYPKILKSIPFQKDLMNTKIKFEKFDEPVVLLEYFTDKKYQKNTIGSLLKKYTIGLPGTLKRAIVGETHKKENLNPDQANGIESFSIKEEQCAKILEHKIELKVNDKDGYIELQANMPEALAAAQFAQKVQTLLQKYITEFKIEKVQSNLEFVQERFNEAKQEFEQIQNERAAYRDANVNLTSARAQAEQERLDTKYELTLSVYSELAKQLEQAKIQVKETTPILTVVDPVAIPNERSKPKRALIVTLFIFLGGFTGIGLVLVLPFVANILDNDRIRKIVIE